MEVIWLIRKLHPDFKTIADFRRENQKAIREVFKQFNLFCKECELFSGSLVAIDGTKFRADNSKKNNYNKKKIERHLKHIDEKINEYLKALDHGDQDQEPEAKLKYTLEELEEKIKTLKSRQEFYQGLEQQLDKSGENEISTTDPDARLMDNKKNGLEVNYNVQIAVDEKNKLILAADVTNNPADQGHLNDMAQASKEALGKKADEALEVVADKGYYQAEDLIECDKKGTVTYVTHQAYANATGDPEYYGDKFKYDPGNDTYLCPMGQILFRTKHKVDEPYQVRYKNFKACKQCPNKDKCTKSAKGRVISRSKHQDFLDTVDARTLDNMDKYLKRQMIVEHPFGTIKRSMDAGYFLTRGLESVNTEAALTFLAYNMKRAIKILGVAGILEKIEENSLLFFAKFKSPALF